MIGATVGNYIVREEIDAAGMGVVYKALPRQFGAASAVKVWRVERSRDATWSGRLYKQAQMLRGIREPHLTEILDFGQLSDERCYVTYQWLDGQSLATLLGQQPQLPVDRALHIAVGIASALRAAHARGVVHGALSAEKIFLVQDGEDRDFVKVIGFSSAARADDDVRSDIYSIGWMLYQMLTGRVPFEGATAQRPAPPSDFVDLDPELEMAILRALRPVPSDRFATVDELLEAIGVPPAEPSPIEAESLAPTEMRSIELASVDLEPLPSRPHPLSRHQHSRLVAVTQGSEIRKSQSISFGDVTLVVFAALLIYALWLGVPVAMKVFEVNHILAEAGAQMFKVRTYRDPELSHARSEVEREASDAIHAAGIDDPNLMILIDLEPDRAIVRASYQITIRAFTLPYSFPITNHHTTDLTPFK